MSYGEARKCNPIFNARLTILILTLILTILIIILISIHFLKIQFNLKKNKKLEEARLYTETNLYTEPKQSLRYFN